MTDPKPSDDRECQRAYEQGLEVAIAELIRHAEGRGSLTRSGHSERVTRSIAELLESYKSGRYRTEAEVVAADAIARRMAIEEAAEACDRWASHSLAAFTDQAIAASYCAQNIRALLRAPTSEKAETRESGWCIEAPGPLFWNGGRCDGWGVIDDAVRFARKEDAENVIAGALWKKENLTVTGHAWVPACSPPADGGG